MTGEGGAVSEWREVALRDLCDSVQYGVTASALPDRRTGTRFLRITDIVPPSIDWDSVPDCDLRADVAEKYRVRTGDILVARTGATVGYAKYLRDPPPAVFASYLVRFQVRDSADPAYVGHVVQSDAYKQFVRANAGGAAQPNANAKTLGAFRVPLPDLKTQRRIGAVLSAFDELIEVNKRRIELLLNLAGSLYREWFVRFRFPGHEDLKLVDSEVGPIPYGWAVRTLGEVCSRITDGAHASPPSTVLGKPMASVKDMTHLSLDLQSCRLISAEDFERLSQQDCKPLVGDVLVSKDGAKYLDKVFEVLVDHDVVVLSSIAVLRPGDPIRSSVLASMLKNPDTKARLKRSVSGAAIPRVVLKDFVAFKNVLPPMDLQDQFDQTGGSLMRVAARLEELNRALASARDLLLPRLVTGRLDISDIDLGPPLAAELA